MSEHQARQREINLAHDALRTDLAPRGRFREAVDGNDYALPLYREYPSQAYYTPNAFDPRTGKPIPRHNERKAAVRRAKGIAL